MRLDLSGDGYRASDGVMVCTRCFRVPVYGVSTCIRCIQHLGAAVAASYLCHTDGERVGVEIENMRRVIAVLHQYGMEPPDRWQAIADKQKPSHRRGPRPTTYARSPVKGRLHGVHVTAHSSLGRSG